MPAREFRPAPLHLVYVAVVMLVNVVWTVTWFPLNVVSVVTLGLSSLVLAGTGVVATTRVTVSETVLEHRIAGRRRTWRLPETSVDFVKYAWPRSPRQWRMVLRGPGGNASVPLVGYSTTMARAIWSAIHERDGGGGPA